MEGLLSGRHVGDVLQTSPVLTEKGKTHFGWVKWLGQGHGMEGFELLKARLDLTGSQP